MTERALTTPLEGRPTAEVAFRTADVLGVKVFYREAGDPSRPAIVLLHGFPSSSHQFRDLIPLLASRFHVLAPDYPGMGYSEAPAPDVLKPTFADVTAIIDTFIGQRTTGPVILYLYDIGASIGLRIATAHLKKSAGLIFQNATISRDGWAPAALAFYERIGGPETPAKLEEASQRLTMERDVFLHRTGARQPDALNPDSWAIDAYAFSSGAKRLFMSRLLMNMGANFPLYPEWAAWLQEHQPQTLILWGQNDPFFTPAAPDAVKQAVLSAALHTFDAGHFPLDEFAGPMAALIIETFAQEDSRT